LNGQFTDPNRINTDLEETFSTFTGALLETGFKSFIVGIFRNILTQRRFNTFRSSILTVYKIESYSVCLYLGQTLYFNGVTYFVDSIMRLSVHHSVNVLTPSYVMKIDTPGVGAC
jgi:hypothetical protein